MRAYIREHGTLNGFNQKSINFVKPIWDSRNRKSRRIFVTLLKVSIFILRFILNANA